MTKTLLTIALAAASLPMAFAAPQASTPANKSNTNTANTQQKTKKHSKKHKATKSAVTPSKYPKKGQTPFRSACEMVPVPFVFCPPLHPVRPPQIAPQLPPFSPRELPELRK